MANVKTRLKAHKNDTTKGRGKNKNKKSSTGPKNEHKAEKMKRPNLRPKTVEDNVRYMLKNGCRYQDREKTVKTKRLKPIFPHESIILRNGLIRHKNKKKLQLIDDILKSELMIADDGNNQKKHTKQNKNNNANKSQSKSLNNNQAGISDQNVSDLTPDSNINETNKDQIYEQKRLQAYEKIISLKKRKTRKRKIYICDYCNNTFTRKASLTRHIHVHLNLHPNKHACKFCKSRFSKRLYLTIHIKRHHPEAQGPKHYICNTCHKPFLLKENLKMHMLTHRNEAHIYRCYYCEKVCTKQALLIRHEKEHLVNGKYYCTVCNIKFECRNRLLMHIKGHIQMKEFICPHCGKEFVRLNSMKRHIQICHGGHRIQCPICKKYLKGHLTEHMRTHENARPHECPDCGQKFTQSTQLNVHRRSHTGARPYKCRICQRAFSHSNALMLHIRRHTGEKPFVCAMCPLTFSQLPHMKAHMLNIHGKVKPYKCEKCKEFFKLKADIMNHSKTCTVGERVLSFEEKIQKSVQIEEIEVETVMSLSRMRYLLALLLTMIATKEKLKYLGFNKRLIDDLLEESLEAMGHKPCEDETLKPFARLRANIAILLKGTVPQDQMKKFQEENKTTEELLELLTNEKKKSN